MAKKEKKQKLIEELREKFKRAKMVIFVNFAQTKASELFQLRKKAKEKNCEFKVAKKTLFSLALKKENVSFNLDEFKNPLGFLFCYDDEIAGAKLVKEFSQNSPLQILKGWHQNKILEKEEIEEWAKLKSRPELLQDFYFVLNSLIWRLIFGLNYPLKGLATILSKIKK